MKPILLFFYRQIQDLIKVNRSPRPLLMSFTAGLAAGLPLFVGAYFGHLDYGVVSGLGGMTFLYLQTTPLTHRMITLLCVAACISGSFMFGLAAHHYPALTVLLITLLVWLVTILVRFLRLPLPGNFFMLMAAMIAAYMPVTVLEIPYFVGLVFMGCFLAFLLGLAYSVYMVYWRGAEITPVVEPEHDFKAVVVDPLIIALFTGGSLLIAQMLDMTRPYWVPITALVIMQGINFAAVWSKQLHRLAGTAAGLGVAWVLLSLPLNALQICLMMLLLYAVIETVVVRHYALAVVFITPMTIFMAEIATGQIGIDGSQIAAVDEIIRTRLWDTVLGSFMGTLGGFCLHWLALREWIARHIFVRRRAQQV